jgi:hypothetical protein
MLYRRSWQYLKRVGLKNVVCHNLDELQYALRLTTARLRHKRHVIQGCISHAGLTLQTLMSSIKHDTPLAECEAGLAVEQLAAGW